MRYKEHRRWQQTRKTLDCRESTYTILCVTSPNKIFVYSVDSIHRWFSGRITSACTGYVSNKLIVIFWRILFDSILNFQCIIVIEMYENWNTFDCIYCIVHNHSNVVYLPIIIWIPLIPFLYYHKHLDKFSSLYITFTSVADCCKHRTVPRQTKEGIRKKDAEGGKEV